MSRGFTLIETLVAFTVLALVLGALYRVFAASARQATLAQDYAYAVQLAEARLAEAGRATVLLPGREVGASERFQWERFSTRHSGNVFLVNVTVLWHHDGKDRSIALATLRATP